MRRTSVLAGIVVLITGIFAAQGRAAPEPAAADKKDPPPVRLSNTANGMGLRLQFAIKDLSPEQKKRSIPILQQLDAKYGPLERAKDAEHQARLDHARKTLTPVDMKFADQRSNLWWRRLHRVEKRYEDRLRDEVLTEKQRPVWEAYRLHFASSFQLAFTGIGTEGAKKLAPICEQVVKDMPPEKVKAADVWELFHTRLAEVNEGAAKQIMNDEQRKKYADLKANREKNERQIDEFERGEAAAKKLAAPPAAEGDGLE